MKKGCFAAMVLTVCLLTGCGNRLQKGIEHLEKGEYQEAIEQFEKQIEKNEDLEEAYRGIGLAQFELENYEEAKEALEEALECGAKESGTIYNLLGTCSVKLELWEEALEYYKKGIAMEDSSGEMLQSMKFNIIGVYERLGDWENAKLYIQEYIAEYPEDEKAKKEAEFLETR